MHHALTMLHDFLMALSFCIGDFQMLLIPLTQVQPKRYAAAMFSAVLLLSVFLFKLLRCQQHGTNFCQIFVTQA